MISRTLLLQTTLTSLFVLENEPSPLQIVERNLSRNSLQDCVPNSTPVHPVIIRRSTWCKGILLFNGLFPNSDCHVLDSIMFPEEWIKHCLVTRTRSRRKNIWKARSRNLSDRYIYLFCGAGMRLNTQAQTRRRPSHRRRRVSSRKFGGVRYVVGLLE